MADHPVTVELYHSDAWNDVTDDVYTRSGISVTRGLGGESGEPVAGSAALTFDDQTGTYNPNNPLSPLYGLVGRNTPLRIRWPAVLVEDFEDATLNVTITDSGDVAWSRTSTESHGGSWSLRSGVIADDESSVATIAIPAGYDTVDLWCMVDSEEGFDEFMIAVDGVTKLVLSGAVAWQLVTLPVSGASTLALTYVKDSSSSTGADAAYVDDVTFGRYRYTGEVADWRTHRTVEPVTATRGDAWTDATAAGLLRRWGRGSKGLSSPSYRAISQTTPFAWWPLEVGDGRATISSPSGLPDGVPLQASPASLGSHRMSGVVGGSTVGPPGAPSAIDLSGGGQLSANIVSPSDTDAWRVEMGFQYKDPVGEFDAGQLIQIRYGTSSVIGLYCGVAPGAEFAIEAMDDLDFSADTASVVLDDGAWHHITLQVESAAGGSSTAYTVTIDGDYVISGTMTDIGYGGPSTVVVSPSGDVDGASHLVFWSGLDIPGDIGYDAFTGHSGERAGDRFTRICGEAGISSTLIGAANDTVRMGPQPTDSLQNVLEEIARTDAGMLYESRHQPGMTFRTGRSLYNASPVVTLPLSGMMPALDPVTGDRTTRNDVTAKRADGAAARYVVAAGRMSTLDPPDGVGTYETSIDVEPENVSTLVNLASWTAHVGTVDEVTYDEITVNVDVDPDIPGIDVGDVIEVTGIPVVENPFPARLLVTRIEDTIGSHLTTITFGTTPASPYDVGVVDDGLSRYASPGSTITAPVDVDDTALTVASTGARWVTAGDDAASLPFQAVVGGELMTVTAVAGTTSPQTFTVTRAVNGVVKAHPSGSDVVLYEPRYYGLRT